MEGLPGVGKSTILNGVRDISGRKVISILGLGEQYKGTAPTASAAKSLAESAKVQSTTIHSFLGKYQGYIEDRGKDSLGAMKQSFKKTVIFVDEASLISTKTMHQVLKLQDKFGFRLVLTGDTKQLGSVEAGKPFEQMLNILPSVKITEIIRQKNESHKEAVIASSKGEIKKTFDIHQNNIIEVKDEDKIAEQASKMFLAKNPKDRDNTLLISPTRFLRDSINNNIVKNLRITNQLHGQTEEFTALRQKDITAADYKFASSFNPGEILKFNKSYKNGIEKGDYLKIKKISQVSNALILEKESNGKTKELLYNLKKDVNQESKFEVFQEHKLKLQQGLKIVFTKNNKEHGLVNSETAIIQDISKNNVTVKIGKNIQTTTIPLDQLKHIDNGYCITIHASQGKTYDNTIAAIGDNELLNNQKSWLVAISRHRNEITAIVADKSKLESQITSNKGIETSAIEMVDNKNQGNSKSLQQPPQNDTIKVSKQLEIQI